MLNIFPGCSVVDIADEVFIQVSWVKAQTEGSILFDNSYQIMYPLSSFWAGSYDSFLFHFV